MTTPASNLVQGGRKCPNCNQYALPKGLVVCCQSCNAIIKADHVIGNHVDGQFLYNQLGKYEKIREFVDKLSPEELTAIDEIIKEKKHA